MAKIVRDKLFEDPDTTSAKGDEIGWEEPTAHPFGVSMGGQVEVGPPGSTHDDVGTKSAFAYTDYQGRIWPIQGIVSFWEAPPKKTLMNILDQLLLHDEISVYEIEDWDDFLIEIPNPDQKADNEDAAFTLDEYPNDPNLKTFHLNRPEHTVSPMLKKNQLKVTGGGSYKYAKEKPLKWRQAMQSESEKSKRKLVAESLDEAMVGEIPIADTTSYISQMAKGVDDKINFISKIQPDCILDFGCADGYILNAIHQKYPNIKGLIGYDLDEKMISLIKSKYPNIEATDNWKEAVYLATEYEEVALSLMSVIHEVYTYSSPQAISKFWKQQVFNPKFKYVVIRDMMPAKEYGTMKPSKEDIRKLKMKLWRMRKYRKSFEKNWGKITSNMRTMLHWLLKYDYKSNWGREVKENYFPVSIETVKSKIPNGWRITYEDHYIFKPIAEKVKKDFGIELKYPTHVKMIIENTNES